MNDKKRKVIIGITGAKGAGKDSLGKFIIDQFPNVKRTHTGFAGPIKQTLSDITGYSLKEIEELKRNSEGKVRHYLQCLADMYKSKNQRCFVDLMAQNIIDSEAELFVITDLRFAYEAGWVKGMGGSIIRVFCVGAEELADRDEHNSERDYKIIQFDWSIQNKGTLSDLKRESQWLAGYIKERYKL